MRSTSTILAEHTGRSFCKWSHYFDLYDRHFCKFINKNVSVWEIGVNAGGSLQMWKKFFGTSASIIGIDINPYSYFEEPQIHVHIGDQSDVNFLQSVINTHGVPNVLIDDGSHIQSDLDVTFKFLYPLMGGNSVYFIEDTHTAYWENYGGGLLREGTIIETSKKCVDALTGRHYESITDITINTNGIFFYDSVVVFEKNQNLPQTLPKTRPQKRMYL